MTKSNEPTLFGARHPSPTSSDGTLRAKEWAELRAPGAWGSLKGADAWTVWFNDPGARDEFIKIFGGLAVRLDRIEENTHVGTSAVDLLKQAG